METYPHSPQNSNVRPCSFDGLSALVVGGGQARQDTPQLVGNGRAICLMLARAGASVICADRDADAARLTVEAIESEGGEARPAQADIANPDAVRALFAAVAGTGRPIDMLVLNAGISDRRPLARITPDSWDAVLDVNLRGHMLCAQAALPLMRDGGSIVFVSSLASQLPSGRNPAYEASKAGLSALCRGVALEGHPRDIRANVVRAGLIDTPMGRAASAARPERAAGLLPFGRQGTPWDIAHAVCFLLSRDAAYVNATELAVDGGLAFGLGRAPTTHSQESIE
jgi:NAD(P)-dependent dehydrogenase (short-subunit alcohol dehydrogenase family)